MSNLNESLDALELKEIHQYLGRILYIVDYEKHLRYVG